VSSKRKWTIEKFVEEVLPLISANVATHIHLPIRESVVLTSAMIDAGLAQLISKKLRGSDHEIVEFLGADGDGRAPCGSFGSRIQLVRLLGIFVDEDVVLLRQLKRLRNVAAHRVNFSVDDPEVRAEITKLWGLLLPGIKTYMIFLEASGQWEANSLR
jgi:hypothetical protein